MNAALEVIELDQLDEVHGGKQTEKGNIGVTVPTGKGNIQVGVQAERTRSSYAKCVDAVSGMAGSTPADLRATCGLPPPPAAGQE